MGRRRTTVAAVLACAGVVALGTITPAPALAAALKPPTGVTATLLSNTQARVSWLAASGATSYDVLRSTTSDGPYNLLGNVTALSYLDDTVTPRTAYFYVVRSRNATRVSVNSTPAALPASLVPPAAVWHTAYPDRVELHWLPAPEAARYDVRRIGPDGVQQTIASTTQTAFTDTAVALGTSYTYKIWVVSATSGGESMPVYAFTGNTTVTTVSTTPRPSETGQHVILGVKVTLTGGGVARSGTVRFYLNGTWFGSDSVPGDGSGLVERHWVAESGMVTAEFAGDPSSGLGSSGAVPLQHTVVEQLATPPPFTWPQLYEYGLPSWPVSAAVADVTGDGRGDALMTTQQFGEESPETDFRLWVFAQQPDGSLATPQILATNAAPAATMRIATGDIDGDGDTDVAVTSNAGIDVFFQSGGGLGAPVSVPVEGGASDLISGDVRLSDMDSDGRADIVAAGLSRVVVIRANADRSFQPAVAVVAARRKQVEVGDVTGDGRPDVVTRDGLRTVIVYAQTSTGGYVQSWYNDAAGGGWNDVNAIAVADVTGDGRADLAATAGGNRPTSRLQVYPQGPAGGLTGPVTYPVWDIPACILLTDLDGDQRRDTVILHAGWATISAMRQRPEGWLGADYFSSISAYGSRDERAMGAGDVTGDGKPDVVIADYNRGLIVLPLL